MKEKSDKGFKRFLSANYWLWARPKNAAMFASQFDMCVDYAQGKPLWTWVGRIALLIEKKTKWDPSLDRKDAEKFIVTGNGVDFKLWERQHKCYPVDTKACSHKFKNCAAKYLVYISTYRPKCVFIVGPYRGGKPDACG